MKEMTMEPGTSKRKNLKNRFGAKYKQSRTHSDKLSAYKHGDSLKSPGGSSDTGGKENRADVEYRRLRADDVYRGTSKGKSHEGNYTKRRYS